MARRRVRSHRSKAPCSSHGTLDQNRMCFFFSSRRRHTRLQGDWSSDVCSSDLHVSVPKQSQQGKQQVSHRELSYSPALQNHVGHAFAASASHVDATTQRQSPGGHWSDPQPPRTIFQPGQGDYLLPPLSLTYPGRPARAPAFLFKDRPRAVLFSACVIAPWCWSTQGWHGMAHLEHGHHARQALRLVAEGGGRRCGLLHESRKIGRASCRERV